MEKIIDIKEITRCLEGSFLTPLVLAEIVDEDGLLNSEVVNYLGIYESPQDINKLESIIRKVSNLHAESAYLTSVLNSILKKDLKIKNVKVDSKE